MVVDETLTQELSFALEKVLNTRHFTAHWLETARVNAWYPLQYAVGDMVVQIVVDLPTIGEEEVTFPRDWWQAFKERWAPQWFLRRWPVLWTRYVAKDFYPEVPVPTKWKENKFSVLLKR